MIDTAEQRQERELPKGFLDLDRCATDLNKHSDVKVDRERKERGNESAIACGACRECMQHEAKSLCLKSGLILTSIYARDLCLQLHDSTQP